MSTASQGGAVSRVRASVATTKAERTARLRYKAGFGVGLGLAEALAPKHPAAAGAARAVGGILRRVASASENSPLTGADGRIDFENERSIYRSGTYWKLYAPGREYIGEPGEWELEVTDVLHENDPFWLLALLEATIEAEARGTEPMLGATCTHYDVLVDLHQVHRPPPSLPIVGPFHARDTPLRDNQIDVTRLPVDVWLDDAGRIRRALLHSDPLALTQIDLSGFGDPDPVELPASEEILPDEDAPDDS